MTKAASRHGRPPSTTEGELSHIALGLFARKGFEATTVDDIAAAAGIGRRTFFRYFPVEERPPSLMRFGRRDSPLLSRLMHSAREKIVLSAQLGLDTSNLPGSLLTMEFEEESIAAEHQHELRHAAEVATHEPATGAARQATVRYENASRRDPGAEPPAVDVRFVATYASAPATLHEHGARATLEVRA